jgi:XRE family aerobic/anaerobic benzoate catabolism transcriptional regulator
MSEIVTFSGTVTPTADTDTDTQKTARFLNLVGQRVRNARQKKGMSRRVLAERSGVSQRYLAQLETGQGNISIGLLLRVAQALEFGIEWLVSPDDPWQSDTARAMILFQRATQKQRQDVLQVLQPSNPSERKANRIALIGLRGAGKSTLGARLANHLNSPFLELNHEIEQSGGMPVNEVIALYGQEGYRLLEHQAVERIVATHDTLILAVAGGIAAQSDTFNYLLDHYHTVWLYATPEDHMNRVRAQGDERPMAGNPDAMKELRNILASREEQYKRADAQVDTSNATEDESLSALLDVVKTNGFIVT